MKTVTVSASRRYDILIERGLLRRAGELVRGVTNAGTVMLVSDDSVWPLYGETVQKSLADAGFSYYRKHLPCFHRQVKPLQCHHLFIVCLIYFYQSIAVYHLVFSLLI